MTTRSSHQLVDHLFRHEAGRMIAVLARIFGAENLCLAEDVVQDAFLKAIQSWGYNSIPDNPAAWLMRVARNKALDIVRRKQSFNHISRELAARLDLVTEQHIEQLFLDDEIRDSQLRMIFACCHPILNEEDQIALTLKAISGFSATEIAKALVMQEAAIQKRLYRARKALQENQVQLEMPHGTALASRLETVLLVIYLLFNEGYNSQKADELIRKDLCAEAMRLCFLLTEQPALQQPSVYALMSLMCFQASRFESRMGEDDTIILLEQQDRNRWSKELIRKGFVYLNHSSKGDTISVYHIESAIAAEHSMAASFSSTNWTRMLTLYDLLAEHKPGPITELNRAVVKAQLGLHGQAIEDIFAIEKIDTLLQSQYMYSAVLGDIYLRAGEKEHAKKYLMLAMGLTCSVAEKKLITQKLGTA
ncbi:sigma-70 family RNA polymerase sigma factor [Pseudoflavitalea sp. G-6-1-2]|uniref:RNA polymerase sigma factor n=1 Tax=Pseudoflavitalea sp. G-6-1-2 TaxID=2728841 RepID=UPI00146D3F4B|nr:sigma-70 family RNA polymerase sigma factor [Pseudoflavitalea sp. G-6-1-2]NML20969.1 sigma-70 family RNA polymerase sigma factor [Pseudoflavitalea sp. G-6-1-2]